FETSQKNQPPPQRRRPANSTNQQTIGIKKLGTLLSSQTTGANDYLRAPRFRASRGRFPPPLCSYCISILFLLSNRPVRLNAGEQLSKETTRSN
ncbi:hypothetical protein, partial [Arthrobacter echini]|uniref:hypothetical protein n=1 Tax=Arthrobacter echini TaxID=1529066 RepID=UPI001CA348A8